jgi:hypothetical protein
LLRVELSPDSPILSLKPLSTNAGGTISTFNQTATRNLNADQKYTSLVPQGAQPYRASKVNKWGKGKEATHVNSSNGVQVKHAAKIVVTS